MLMAVQVRLGSNLSLWKGQRTFVRVAFAPVNALIEKDLSIFVFGALIIKR